MHILQYSLIYYYEFQYKLKKRDKVHEIEIIVFYLLLDHLNFFAFRVTGWVK